MSILETYLPVFRNMDRIETTVNQLNIIILDKFKQTVVF